MYLHTFFNFCTVNENDESLVDKVDAGNGACEKNGLNSFKWF